VSTLFNAQAPFNLGTMLYYMYNLGILLGHRENKAGSEAAFRAAAAADPKDTNAHFNLDLDEREEHAYAALRCSKIDLLEGFPSRTEDRSLGGIPSHEGAKVNLLRSLKEQRLNVATV
jgi:hypothetical protein